MLHRLRNILFSWDAIFREDELSKILGIVSEKDKQLQCHDVDNQK